MENEDMYLKFLVKRREDIKLMSDIGLSIGLLKLHDDYADEYLTFRENGRVITITDECKLNIALDVAIDTGDFKPLVDECKRILRCKDEGYDDRKIL